MNRYLFPISGHLEVNAESLEKAQEMIKDKTITHYDQKNQIFVIVVPASYTPFHQEEIKY